MLDERTLMPEQRHERRKIKQINSENTNAAIALLNPRKKKKIVEGQKWYPKIESARAQHIPGSPHINMK